LEVELSKKSQKKSEYKKRKREEEKPITRIIRILDSGIASKIILVIKGQNKRKLKLKLE
jgi:hypothetical protein